MAPQWRRAVGAARRARVHSRQTPRAHRQQPPITYRDGQDRVWSVSPVAVLKVVAPAIDGPNVALVIRFEHEGEKRFVRWLGGDEWRGKQLLHRLFAEAEV